MNRTMRRALAAGAVLALSTVGPLAAQTPNFSKYVALGDSYGAGFGSGCLVARHQAFSGPNILAKQLGITDFQQPTISDPGIPTCNALKTLVPSVMFGPISAKTGAPTNALLGRPYDNLSVPGFKIADVSDTLTGGLADVVLRGKGSALAQALSLNPTFITVTIVGNDILTAAGAGFLLDGVTATPLPLFTSKYNAVAATLKSSGRTGVFLGTGDVRQLPLLTAIKPVVTDATGTPILVGGQTVPLLGPRTTSTCSTAPCPLPPGTLVTLGANAPLDALGGKSLLGVGFGIPCAVAPMLPQCGRPLPDGSFSPPSTVNVGVLLYPDEIQAIDDRIRAMNDVIKVAASANGFIYFDTYALAQSLGATGFDMGGMHITRDFVTGGFFSYGDAVHPSNIGYMVVVDAVIQAINGAYGTAVPRPDFSTVLFTPDVPAAGAAGVGAAVDTSIFFNEEAWRAFFDEFTPQDPSFRLVLPGSADPETIDRTPVVRIPARRREP